MPAAYRTTVLAAFYVAGASISPVRAQHAEDLLRAVFSPEPVVAPADLPAPPPATFTGKPRPTRHAGIPAPTPRGVGTDRFIGDGAESALSIDIADTDVLVGALNQAFFVTPSLAVSSDGNNTWGARTAPAGTGTFNFYPFDPWTSPGNAPGELFESFVWADTAPSFNTRAVIGRSIDGGGVFSRFYEASNRIVFQDRQMLDIDRTEGLGGGVGATHDGKAYLCFDNFGAGGAGYVASYVHVVSTAGVRLSEITVSSAAVFNGSQNQPCAGAADGQVILNSAALSGTPGIAQARFHLLTNATTLQVNRSTINYNQTGQQLGSSQRWGVNGHRINQAMSIDIDRSAGPRRGRVYLASNRNPNRLNPALDQGNVHLSFSTNSAQTWSDAVIPGQAVGKTQYFSMIDVDDNGWVHVAYYQNETGLVNGGVLNASTANLYYTFSKDGGATWAPHRRVNDDANTLDFEDPPPDRGADEYYLIGDYQQVKAGGRGIDTRVYVLWTGYDKDRGDFAIGDKRERVICSTVIPCLADFNRDGSVNSQDFFDFLASFFAGAPEADFNGDNAMNSQDFFDFLTVFFAGCP